MGSLFIPFALFQVPAGDHKLPRARQPKTVNP